MIKTVIFDGATPSIGVVFYLQVKILIITSINKKNAYFLRKISIALGFHTKHLFLYDFARIFIQYSYP